jgi:hypothetical protein
MINLLPPERAAQIRYGRSNANLRRWLFAAAAAIAGLAIIIVSGMFYINQQSKDLQSNIALGKQQLTNENLTQVQSDAKGISSDVKLINQVLGREIRFSDLMLHIGKVMPSGTILSGLTLTNVSSAVDVSANALDYNSAAQIAVNLSDPGNNLFAHVDIVNITCQHDHPTSPYPCTAIYKALFSKTATNSFLNISKASGS